MATIVFIKQVCEDGGIHTGIEVNGLTCFDRLEIEGEEYDPVLTWFVEVYAEGDALPSDAQGALRWFQDQAPLIKEGLGQLADRLQVGLDHNTYPLHWSIPNAPAGIRLKVLCDAVRRRVGLDMARLVTDVRMHWEEILQRLPEANAYTL